MDWTKSPVMEEFIKIVTAENLLDNLGNSDAVTPEPNPYKEDAKTIEEKQLKSPEKHIMEIAHPEPVFIAESRGEGGLVENEIEQQEKTIRMINKVPNGSLVGRYAEAVTELVKLANQCDDLGHTDAAGLVTDAATDLIEQMKRGNFFQ